MAYSLNEYQYQIEKITISSFVEISLMSKLANKVTQAVLILYGVVTFGLPVYHLN